VTYLRKPSIDPKIDTLAIGVATLFVDLLPQVDNTLVMLILGRACSPSIKYQSPSSAIN
jgi:hypothetical protein